MNIADKEIKKFFDDLLNKYIEEYIEEDLNSTVNAYKYEPNNFDELMMDGYCYHILNKEALDYFLFRRKTFESIDQIKFYQDLLNCNNSIVFYYNQKLKVFQTFIVGKVDIKELKIYLKELTEREDIKLIKVGVKT